MTFLKNIHHDTSRGLLSFIYPRVSEVQLLVMIVGLLIGSVHWSAMPENREIARDLLTNNVYAMLFAAIMVYSLVKTIPAIFTHHPLTSTQKSLGALIVFGVYGWVGFSLFFLSDSYEWSNDVGVQINFVIGFYFAVMNLLRFSLILLSAQFKGKIIDYTATRFHKHQSSRLRLVIGLVATAILIEILRFGERDIILSMYMAVNYVLLADMVMQLFGPLHRLEIYREFAAVPPKPRKTGLLPKPDAPFVRPAPRGYTRVRRSLRFRRRNRVGLKP